MTNLTFFRRNVHAFKCGNRRKTTPLFKYSSGKFAERQWRSKEAAAAKGTLHVHHYLAGGSSSFIRTPSIGVHCNVVVVHNGHVNARLLMHICDSVYIKWMHVSGNAANIAVGRAPLFSKSTLQMLLRCNCHIAYYYFYFYYNPDLLV